jgi:heme/copper-type cytochrome/quinol oxidase subunit 2
MTRSGRAMHEDPATRQRRPWGTLAVGIVLLAGGVAVLAGRALGLGQASPELTVRVTAHQWWWQFEYPTLGIRTHDELHLPSNSRVRFELASADIVHSFWMPGMDEAVPVAPGPPRVLDLDISGPGRSYGTCDATCGCGDVCMRFPVVASNAGDFAAWVADQRAQPPPARPATTAAPACARDATACSGQCGQSTQIQ